MCKIAVIPGLSDESTVLAWNFVKKLAKEMSSYQDDDGFGYAAIDGEGKLFGERWFNPKEVFSNREEKALIAESVIKKYKGFVKGALPVYNRFGDVHERSLRAIMLHARNATTAKVFSNTHPFVIDGTALIHNGVISNYDALKSKKGYSTCDSEVILTEYLDKKVADDSKAIQNVASRLDGYYACGVLSKNKDGVMLVDVFKEKTARLKGYFIKELNTMVFATPGHSDEYGPVPSVCRDMGLTLVDQFELESEKLVRIDAMTGEVLDYIGFDSTFKKKEKKNKGGNDSGDTGGSIHDKYNNLFRSSRHNRHQTVLDKQKDGELEMELLAGCFTEQGDDNQLRSETDWPQLPAGTREVMEDLDWEQDSDGIWHKKAL